MTVMPTGLNRLEGQLPDELDAAPAAARIRLGTRLRRLREEAEISREKAGAAIRSSASKISRLELGRTAIKARDLADLLALYGASDEAERAGMLALARHASAPGWWQGYGDAVPAWVKPYLGLEQAASLIRGYDVQFVPGLLQTPAYARAVFGLPGGSTGDQAERRVAVRMRRQEILHRADPPYLWVVIDESALRRPVGGTAVMRAQIEHLIEITQLRHVNIQVLPFRAGGHAAGGGPVILLRFAGDQLPDVVYLEQLNSALYPSRPADLTYYWNVLNQLATEADPPIASTMILNQIRKEL
ncbi:MAG: helix-turn-helix transcriptional regulator [Streptosporangiaceae bacterium]|nr:helix-turn-helix transcriptional regulator [Streptosporangiaceae bacterium]MBV9856669.1 helix-turn-helix transcriptional regulator [Streptosporangiaceae bacterium]